MPKHETRNNLKSNQSGNEIWPVHVILQKKIVTCLCYKCGLETSSRPFCVCKELSISVKENIETLCRHKIFINNQKNCFLPNLYLSFFPLKLHFFF